MSLTFTAGTPAESTASVTTTTVTLPSQVDGDYTIIAVALNASSGTITTPTGWTDILPQTNGTASTSLCFAVFYRKWVSGDPTTVDVTTKSGRVGALPVKVSGADPTTFVEVAASVTQAASGDTSIVAPSVTPTAASVTVHAFAARSASNGVFITWTPTGDLTEVGETGAQAASQTNASCCFDYAPATAGTASGTKTVTASDVTTGAMGVSFVLKEAAGAGGTDASVTAVAATGTGASAAPSVAAGSSVQASAASASGSLSAPSVSASATVTAVVATATGTALAPAVTAGGSQTVNAVVATATGTAPSPVVSGSSTVTATSSTSTAQALAPSVRVDVTMAPAAMAGTATFPVPTITGVSPDATVVAPVLTATGYMPVPEVTAITPLVKFTPPTFETAMRTLTEPLKHYRLTQGISIVRVNGVFREMLRPTFEQLQAAGGVDGRDFFMGGYVYEIGPDIAAELEAAGFTTPQQQTGFGRGPFGLNPFGE